MIASWLALCLLAVTGCEDDWASRMGILPAAKAILCPFPSYSVHRLKTVLAQDHPAFCFAVIGGTGLGGDSKEFQANAAYYQEALETISLFEPQPSFLVHLGDVSAAPRMGEVGWGQLVTLSSPYRVPDSLEDLCGGDQPVLVVLPGEKDLMNRRSEKLFLETLGFSRERIYFSFSSHSMHFFVLNSEEFDDGILMRWFGWNREQNRIRGAQFRWLEKELEQSAGRPKIVFVHKPFFPPIFSGHEGYCMDQYYLDRERVLRLFRKHRVAAVFSGHDRVFSHCKIEGIDFFTVGSAGQGRLKKPWEYRHILLVAVYSTERMKVFVVNPEKRMVEDEVLVDLGDGAQ